MSGTPHTLSVDVRFGSIASIPPCPRHVCLSSDSNRYADILDRQLRATSGHRKVLFKYFVGAHKYAVTAILMP